MSDTPRVALLAAGLASIALDPNRVQIDPHKLKFYRSRIEPSDPVELKALSERRIALAQSWLDKPIHEIFVRAGDYAIADGNERVSGLLLLGVEQIIVTLLSPETTDAELDSFSVLTDVHKTKLKSFELAMVIHRYIESTGANRTEAAATFRMAAGHLSKLLSVFDCTEQVQALAAEGKLGVEAWYAISKSPNPDETLRIQQRGGDREAVAASAKPKPDKPPAPPERHDKLAIPFTNAVVVVKAKRGQEPLNLSGTRKLLVDALAKVDKAIADNFGIKTAARSFADTKDKAPKVRKTRKPTEVS